MKIPKIAWISFFLILFISNGVFGEIIFRNITVYKDAPTDSLMNPNNFQNLKNQVFTTLQFFGNYKFESTIFSFSISDLVGIYPKGANTSISNKINELYLTITPFEFLFFDIGKVVIKKGVGYFKNPSDFLVSRYLIPEEDKDSLDKYLEGVIGVRLQVFSDIGTFELMASPRIYWEKEKYRTLEYFSSVQSNSQFLLSYSKNLFGLDINPILYYGDMFKAGINLSYVVGEALELHLEGSIDEKYTAKYLEEDEVVIPPNIVIGKTNKLVSREKSWIPCFILGGHYTYKDYNFMLEYFYNGKGMNSEEWNNTLKKMEDTYNTFSSTNLFALASLNTYRELVEYYGIPGLSQHYLMLRIAKNFPNNLVLEWIGIGNMVDLGTLQIFRISKKDDYTVINASISFPISKKNSEFGLMLENFIISFNISLFLL